MTTKSSATAPPPPCDLLTSHRDNMREQHARYWQAKPRPRTAEQLARDQIRGTAVVGMIVVGMYLLAEGARWVGTWAGW